MMHISRLDEVVRADPRYPYEAYEFIFNALTHTQAMLCRLPGESDDEEATHHVSGPELLDGVRDLALREFGLMARTVFRMWGIDSTADFGHIVFNLIDANLMSRTDQDSLADFVGVYDLDEALVHNYRIQLDEV